jgi:hypothetical protein
VRVRCSRRARWPATRGIRELLAARVARRIDRAEVTMSTIKLSHPNPLPVAEARRRLAEVITRHCQLYGVQQRWDGDRLVLTGSLLSGHADFNEKSVDVELTLGAGASSEKDRSDVEWGVKHELERHLRA